MFRYSRSLGAIWLAGLVGLAWGFDFEGHVKMDVPWDFSVNFEYPNALLFWFGLGVGYLIVPWIINRFDKTKEYERFLERLGREHLGRAKIKLFKNLSRAYHSWGSSSPDYPKSLTALIKGSKFPKWVPVEKGDDLFETIERERKAIPSDLWLFLHDVFKELDGYIRYREEPKLLLPTEMDELHEARQTLSYFWDDTAVRVFRRRELRYRNVEPNIDGATLKVLVHLEIENHTAIQGSSEGPKELFFLGAVYFGIRKLGFWEWLWNPCLTTSENLKV